MRKTWSSLAVTFGLGIPVFIAGQARAQFVSNSGSTYGTIVVERVGTGSAALASTATATFLDEYNTSGSSQAAPVYSLALPTAASSPNAALTVSGTATSEGFVSLSADGSHLVVVGYNAAPGTTVTSAASTAVNRVIGTIDATGTIDTTTALTDAFTAGNIRSAVSADGTTFYATGSIQGLRTAADGSTTSSLVSSTVTNERVANIFNNTVYFSSGSGTHGIYMVGSSGSLPSGTGVTATNVFNTGSSSSPYDFYFADANDCYVTDDSSIASGGGIQKWVNSNGTWSLAYTMGTGVITSTGAASTVGARSITGYVANGTVNLFVTTADGTANRILSIQDTLTGGTAATANATTTTLATSTTNELFRGLDFAPFLAGASSPEPGSLGLLAGPLALIAGRLVMRKRKRSAASRQLS